MKLRQPDSAAARQKDRQADKQTDRGIDERENEREIDSARHIGRLIDSKIYRHADRHKYR